MNNAWKKGFSFGLTSGIITTLGMMVGLHSSTGSTMVVIGGVLAIAVADSLSDALGIHISEEAENVHSHKEIWQATISTFLTKLFFASTFIVPILLLPLETAVIASVAYGLSLITIFSAYMARKQGQKVPQVVLEHLTIASAVILITHYVGNFIATLG